MTAWDFIPGAAFSIPGKMRLMDVAGVAHLVRVWLCSVDNKVREISADDCRACHLAGKTGHASRVLCKKVNAKDPEGSELLLVARVDNVSRKVYFDSGAALPLDFLLGMAAAGRLLKVERKATQDEK